MSFPARIFGSLLLAGFAWLRAVPVGAGEGLWDDLSYRLGKGLWLGDSGFWLGGYASVRVEDYRHAPWRAQLSDLSLFLGWQQDRWRFFSEFELGDGLEVANGQALTTHQGYFDLERLYLDYVVDNAWQIRGGKFLTPIGRWNQIHADPLVWTTSKPMIVEGPFPRHATGGMVLGNFNAFGQAWGYSVYGGNASALDFVPGYESSDAYYGSVVGFRLNHELPGRFLLGVSYAHYVEKNYHPGGKDLIGLDAFWTRRRFELSGEFIYRFGGSSVRRELNETGSHPGEWGLYAQGVAPLVGNLFMVARYEAFQREGVGSPAQFWLGGLAYRPVPPLVFKLEYSFRHSSDPVPPSSSLGGGAEGFAASVAVLF